MVKWYVPFVWHIHIKIVFFWVKFFFHSTIMYTNSKQHDANIQTCGQTDRPDSNEYKINRVLNIIVELVVNLQLDTQSRDLFIYFFMIDDRNKRILVGLWMSPIEIKVWNASRIPSSQSEYFFQRHGQSSVRYEHWTVCPLDCLFVEFRYEIV